jgi:hypothetical protein
MDTVIMGWNRSGYMNVLLYMFVLSCFIRGLVMGHIAVRSSKLGRATGLGLTKYDYCPRIVCMNLFYREDKDKS